MAVDKNILKQCLRDQRNVIENAVVVERDLSLEENGNYVFVGVRHSGKSYMLYQRVKQLLAVGHTWEEILFVNFDDERLMEFDVYDFNVLIETHLELYGQKPYVFLDEVQRIEGWDKFARRLANEKYTVYITGSNAKMLSSEVATTLGGRFFIMDVYPYSFREYLHAAGVTLDAHWQFSTPQRSEVLRHFTEYFYYGGLPEILQFANKRDMISSIYQKIYLGDICTRYKIKNERALSIMIKKLAETVCRPVSYNRLNNTVVSTGLKVSLPTIIDYLTAAQDSWLLLAAENHLSKLADKESIKKYYFVDNGLLNLFLYRGETALLENVVAIELCRRYGKENLVYYSADKEIDFVIEEEHTAIQVCYNPKDEQTSEREYKPLLHFQKSHPEWKCFILSYDTEDTISVDDCIISVLPIWKWLLQ